MSTFGSNFLSSRVGQRAPRRARAVAPVVRQRPHRVAVARHLAARGFRLLLRVAVVARSRAAAPPTHGRASTGAGSPRSRRTSCSATPGPTSCSTTGSTSVARCCCTRCGSRSATTRFFALLRTWVERHRYGSVTSAMFESLAAEVAGDAVDDAVRRPGCASVPCPDFPRARSEAGGSVRSVALLPVARRRSDQRRRDRSRRGRRRRPTWPGHRRRRAARRAPGAGCGDGHVTSPSSSSRDSRGSTASPSPDALSSASLRTQATRCASGSAACSPGCRATSAKPGNSAAPSASTSTPTGPASVIATTERSPARARLTYAGSPDAPPSAAGRAARARRCRTAGTRGPGRWCAAAPGGTGRPRRAAAPPRAWRRRRRRAEVVASSPSRALDDAGVPRPGGPPLTCAGRSRRERSRPDGHPDSLPDGTGETWPTTRSP